MAHRFALSEEVILDSSCTIMRKDPATLCSNDKLAFIGSCVEEFNSRFYHRLKKMTIFSPELYYVSGSPGLTPYPCISLTETCEHHAGHLLDYLDIFPNLEELILDCNNRYFSGCPTGNYLRKYLTVPATAGGALAKITLENIGNREGAVAIDMHDIFAAIGRLSTEGPLDTLCVNNIMVKGSDVGTVQPVDAQISHVSWRNSTINSNMASF